MAPIRLHAQQNEKTRPARATAGRLQGATSYHRRDSGECCRPSDIRLARLRSARKLKLGSEASLGAFSDKDQSWLKITMGKLKLAWRVFHENYQDFCENESESPSFWVYVALLRLRWQLKDEVDAMRDNYYASFRQENSQDQDGAGISSPMRQELVDLERTLALADLAYESDGNVLRTKLKEINCTLMQKEWDTVPGKASYYVALNKEERKMYVGIKGSTCITDLLTDLCMTGMPYNLNAPFVKDGDRAFFCHEGIGKVAKLLADDIQHITEVFIEAGHQVIIVGHSLGASLAIILSLILRSRLGVKFPDLLEDNGRKIRAIAYAPPPVMDLDSARACATFTTSVVNSSDIIPRTSVTTFMCFTEWAKRLNNKFKEMNVDPSKWRTFPKFLQVLFSRKSKLSVDQVATGFRDGYLAVDAKHVDHLYVPGRIILMYKNLSKKRGLERSKQEKGGVLVVDGASPVLAYPSINGSFVTDHMTCSYKKCFEFFTSSPMSGEGDGGNSSDDLSGAENGGVGEPDHMHED